MHDFPDLECLYKFKESGYYNPKAEPPESTLRIGIPAPPSSRPSTATSSTGSRGHASSRRAKSVPVPKFTPVPTLHIPTPAQCWSARLSETPYGVFDPNIPTSSIPKGGLAAEKEEKRVSTVSWPAQKIVGKYDRPYEPLETPTVFDEPLPTPAPSNGGYVFVPNGDGTCQVYSPPVVWPQASPVPPTPQRSASSRATIGSAEGADMRQQLWQRYTQQQQQAQQELQQKQQRFEEYVGQLQQQPPVPPATTSGRQERVKSACSFRAKPSIPQRPIHSAGPTRPPAQTGHSYSQRWKGDEVTGDKLKAQPKAGKTTKKKIQTKAAKVVPEEQTKIVVTTWDERKVPNDAEPLGRMQPPKSPVSAERLATKENLGTGTSYEEMVAKYGWRAEVHGDPYNIK